MKSSVASPHSTASARFNFEREYESVLVANAVQPQPASNRKVSAVERQPACLAPGSGQGYTAVPLLTDTPGLRLGKPAEDDIFAVTRTNSNLLRRKDLQWYLDKTLWKLGVHKKARRDFMAVSLLSPDFIQAGLMVCVSVTVLVASLHERRIRCGPLRSRAFLLPSNTLRALRLALHRTRVCTSRLLPLSPRLRPRDLGLDVHGPGRQQHARSHRLGAELRYARRLGEG